MIPKNTSYLPIHSEYWVAPFPLDFPNMSICKLPAELLSEIFLLHVRAEQRKLESDSMIIPQWKEWYSPLYVCKDWNDVMMHNPLLWNFVSMSSTVECTRTMLERSKNIPIRVQPTGPERHSQIYDEHGLRLILEQNHRIRDLVIYITDAVAKVLSSISYPHISLPMIRSLSVSNETTNTDLFQVRSSFPFDPSPSLCTLSISGYSIMELKKVLRTGLQSVSLLPSEAIRGNRNEARRIEYTDDGIKLSLYKTLEDLAQMESLQDTVKDQSFTHHQSFTRSNVKSCRSHPLAKFF